MLNIELVDSSGIEYITCEDVSQEEIEDIIKIVIPQMEGILSSLRGYGLSAPQVGIKKKFFIMLNENGKTYDLYFNSKYLKEGSRYKSTEGCLSYDLGKRYSEVKRYKSIKALYEKLEDGKLVKKSEKLKGLKARAFQHETDHLFGTTIFTK